MPFRTKPALWTAAILGQTEEVQRLLLVGADIQEKTQDGSSALHRAASGGHSAIVELLLELGADANVETNNGDTPLLSAASGGHIVVMKLLLDKGGAKVSATSKLGVSPLHQAAECGNCSCVLELLGKVADVNVKTVDGDTALHRATARGHGTSLPNPEP